MAALQNKTCVTELAGELYYNGSREGAEAFDVLHGAGEPPRDGSTLCVRWFHPARTDAQLLGFFGRHGHVKYLEIDAVGRPGVAPVTEGGLEYNFVLVTFLNCEEAAAAKVALQGLHEVIVYGVERGGDGGGRDHWASLLHEDDEDDGDAPDDLHVTTTDWEDFRAGMTDDDEDYDSAPAGYSEDELA